MNSASQTRPGDATGKYFAIESAVEKYRWVGRRTAADGAILVGVRYAPVAATWRSIGTHWIPETRVRPACDFPIFYSIVRCFSRRALQVLSPYIAGSLEVLPLQGLDDEYVGVHCIRWIEGAVNLDGVDQDRVSIHSTAFVPRLRAMPVHGLDVFGVPELITKIFVSERFKSAVEVNGLVGLEFREITLC